MLEGGAVVDGGNAARGVAAPPPEQFGDAVLRTLQRRVGQWRAEHGASARSTSPRNIRRGGWGCRTSPSPTSWASACGGMALPHRLYQFALAHSGWRHARVVLGGESFQALAAGLQEALWMAGGVPEEHRTDSLSAAFNNLAEQRRADQALPRPVRALRDARQPQQPGRRATRTAPSSRARAA